MKISRTTHQFWILTIILSTSQLVSNGQMMSVSELPKISLVKQGDKKPLQTDELLVDEISEFDNYPPLFKFKGQHIFFVQDSVFGKLPFKLFIPENYNPLQRHPLILLLHGAVMLSKFGDAENAGGTTDDDPFYSKLCESGFIVIKPFADSKKGFNWSENQFGSNRNYTFNSLINLIAELKKTINIDDDKVFAFGHSDGSDGVFALGVYKPSTFAGLVAYNSKLSNIFAHDYYIANAINRQLYLVHSDKDAIRPIEQTRDIVKVLDSLKVPMEYKEYHGYTHEDKHLDIDYPNSVSFIKKTVRNPFPKQIYWETSNHLFAKCDWIVIDDWDLNLPRAAWHKVYNVKGYNKNTHSYYHFDYYTLDESAAIRAVLNNNVFEVYTSRVIKFDLLISPKMLDLNKQITVLVNGKRAFKGLVRTDRKFYLDHVQKTSDRKAIWVNSITINAVE